MRVCMNLALYEYKDTGLNLSELCTYSENSDWPRFYLEKKYIVWTKLKFSPKNIVSELARKFRQPPGPWDAIFDYTNVSHCLQRVLYLYFK